MNPRPNSRRSTFSKRKKSLDSEAKPLTSSILEEAKRLEYLNRQIKRSTNQNIVKQLSDYRKSVSPTQKNLEKVDSTLVHIYEHLLKKPSIETKINSLYTENFIKSGSTSKSLERKKKPHEMSEFAQIEFQDTVWPEESILDDKLFGVLNSNDFKKPSLLTWVDKRPKIRNIRIKSRLGEIERKYFKAKKRTSAELMRKSPPRVLTPWIFH
jgi:dGTP triphosphohydrolase